MVQKNRKRRSQLDIAVEVAKLNSGSFFSEESANEIFQTLRLFHSYEHLGYGDDRHRVVSREPLSRLCGDQPTPSNAHGILFGLGYGGRLYFSVDVKVRRQTLLRRHYY